MPAGPGEDAERFAARELEIVAMLRSRGRDFDPTPAERERAKQRLLSVLSGPVPVPDLAARSSAAPVVADSVPDPAAVDSAAAELLRQVTEAPVVSLTLVPDLADAPADAEPASRSGRVIPARPATTAQPRRPGGRHSMPDRPPGRADEPRPRSAQDHRFRLVGAAALVLAMALCGLSMLSSRDALPGQSLYGVKRVAESAGLALTFDEVSKARRLLELASTRLDEVERLVSDDPHVTTQDPELVTSALRQFDDSTGEAARILLGTDDSSGDAARDDLRSWAAHQSARLSGLKPALPASTGTDDALQLLVRVVGRTDALQVQDSCAIPPNSVDDLGPIPACPPDPAGTGLTPDPAVDAPGGSSGTIDPSGPSADPASPRTSISPDASRGPAAGGGGGSATRPNSSGRADSSRQNSVETEDPTPDRRTEPDGSIAGVSSEPEPTSSPAPASSGDRDDSSGDDSQPGLPPVDIPPLLSGLPGVSL